MTALLKSLYYDIKKGGYFSSLAYTMMNILPGESGNRIRGTYISRKIQTCGAGLNIGKGVILNHTDCLSIGNDVIINIGVIIEAGGGIEIGDDVLIGPSVKIWSINHNFENISIPIRKQGWSKDLVKIGNDVWLGSGVIVLPGSVIPDGVVVAASSTVTRSSDIKPYSICAGTPAKMIAERK